MSLPEENILSLEQFYERRAETNERLEYMEIERQYSQKDVLKEKGTVQSSVLAGFEVKVEEIF